MRPDLIEGLAQLCHHRFKANPLKAANQIAKLSQLVADFATIGIELPDRDGLQRWHIYALVDLWQKEQRAPQRIKQQLLDLYWWACEVQRGWIFPPDFVLTTTKLAPVWSNPAWALADSQRLPDARQELALLLMEAFGLTLTEAIQFKVSAASRGNAITVSVAIAHNRQARVIPIISLGQKHLLQRIRELSGSGALLGEATAVETYQTLIERQCASRGFRPLVGLRYWYAQRRYHELSGLTAPLAGGTKTEFLPPTQRDKDRAARKTLAAELGLMHADALQPFLG